MIVNIKTMKKEVAHQEQIAKRYQLDKLWALERLISSINWVAILLSKAWKKHKIQTIHLIIRVNISE